MHRTSSFKWNKSWIECDDCSQVHWWCGLLAFASIFQQRALWRYHIPHSIVHVHTYTVDFYAFGAHRTLFSRWRRPVFLFWPCLLHRLPFGDLPACLIFRCVIFNVLMKRKGEKFMENCHFGHGNLRATTALFDSFDLFHGSFSVSLHSNLPI
jgi:hypothetical protein